MFNKVLSVRIIILSLETCKFDFEYGIRDWEKTGTAFNNQPTYGDNPTARNRGQPANQQGDWWIGGAEDRPSKSATAGRLQGDAPQGTLTSPYFKITGGQIAFLIGGGCNMNVVRAELIVGNKVRPHTLQNDKNNNDDDNNNNNNNNNSNNDNNNNDDDDGDNVFEFTCFCLFVRLNRAFFTVFYEPNCTFH